MDTSTKPLNFRLPLGTRERIIKLSRPGESQASVVVRAIECLEQQHSDYTECNANRNTHCYTESQAIQDNHLESRLAVLEADLNAELAELKSRLKDMEAIQAIQQSNQPEQYKEEIQQQLELMAEAGDMAIQLDIQDRQLSNTAKPQKEGVTRKPQITDKLTESEVSEALAAVQSKQKTAKQVVAEWYEAGKIQKLPAHGTEARYLRTLAKRFGVEKPIVNLPLDDQ